MTSMDTTISAHGANVSGKDGNQLIGYDLNLIYMCWPNV